MKKSVLIILVILIMAIVVTGCILAYMYFTKDINTQGPEDSTEVSSEAIFTKENYPRVDGSTATQPLMNALAANFLAVEENTLDYKYNKTHKAYLNLIDREADLIIVTEPSEEELAYAREKNVELEITPIVNEGFVFLVNIRNKVENLSLQQIQDIYSGKITNWKDIGGEDSEIIAYQRPVNSGSQTGMLSLVMNGVDMIASPTEQVLVGMGDLIEAVADYNNGENSIGYSYYYYANTMYTKDTIKLLSINGIKPEFNTIKNNEYPIGSSYYIVIRKDEPESSNTRKLQEAMLSERGQKVAKEAGYVPVK